ncbi:hypothetical protein J6590_004202 [Homalodisca vitripennis]|nr:hypothetical protein J6590_004202 [Homalodisca vitripennis]
MISWLPCNNQLTDTTARHGGKVDDLLVLAAAVNRNCAPPPALDSAVDCTFDIQFAAGPQFFPDGKLYDYQSTFYVFQFESEMHENAIVLLERLVQRFRRELS